MLCNGLSLRLTVGRFSPSARSSPSPQVRKPVAVIPPPRCRPRRCPPTPTASPPPPADYGYIAVRHSCCLAYPHFPPHPTSPATLWTASVSHLVGGPGPLNRCSFFWPAAPAPPPTITRPICLPLPIPSSYVMSFDLDESQQHAWELFMARKNVALVGRAGSGKSTVMARAITHARRVHGAGCVGVMAWMTHAANLIGGTTFHKFLCIGIAELPKDVILNKVLANCVTRARIKATKVIFIDELPTFPARWLAVLEYVVRQLAPAHNQWLPWGGVQVVGTCSASGEWLGLRGRRGGCWVLHCSALYALVISVVDCHRSMRLTRPRCVLLDVQLVATCCSWGLS